jgi:HK97 family phage prohead protease
MNLFELRSEYVNIVEHRRFPYAGIELREVPNGTGGTKLEFDGYACITEASYPMADMFGQYDETIVTGAFARTLAEGPDVAFLVNHEGLSLARTKAGTLRLAEDLIGPGLHSGADLDPRSMAVQELRLAVESGNLDQMSFAFRVFTGGNHWNDDYTERHITAVNLHRGDVSAVNFGANELAFVAHLRHAGVSQEITERFYLPVLGRLAAELRAGADLDPTTMATLRGVLNLVADADESIDAAQAALADVLGVPNPDVDESSELAADDHLEHADGMARGLAVAQAAALRLRAASSSRH